MTQTSVEIGYAISSEEHKPKDIIQLAKRAEEVGFTFALISDHFHPWIDAQGQSPFVWAVLGGIAQATYKLKIGTGVTCPTIRIHPAIIAQATATVASMMPERFFLGVGTGENLNEHILGDRWPPYEIRAEMLEEAIEVIRLLWQGGMQSHHGKYYTVENARIYTLPDILPEIMIAAGGSESASLAGKLGDGLISTTPDAEIVKEFEHHSSNQRPKYGKLTFCWAEDEEDARQTAYQYWRTSGLKGNLSQILPLPSDFEGASKMVTKDDIAEILICGNDTQQYMDGIREYVDAGFDHIYLHQIGPDQDGFFDFYQQHLLPQLALLDR